ncbi:hypothetical protein DMC47_30765 [Nostoc sp. 3335mG]|nr:hypothetical protein DMC47_30765 [Nostoc sp. 3335mG]
MIVRRIRDLPITVKMSAGFGIMLVVLIATCLLILAQLSRLADEQDYASAAGDASDLAAALRTDVETMRGSVRGFLLTNAESQRRRAEHAMIQYKIDGRRLDLTLARTDERLRPLVARNIALIDQALAPGLQTELVLGTNPATHAKAIALVSAPSAERNRSTIDHALDRIGNELLSWSNALTDSARVAMRDTLLVIAIGSIMAAIVIAVMATYIVKGICAPLRDMTRSLRLLAEGDLDADIPDYHRGDEVGDIMRAIRLFRVSAVEKLQLEAEAHAARSLMEEKRRQADEAKARLSAEQELMLGKLGSALARLAIGDLSVLIEGRFPAVYEPLRLEFNAAVAQLREAIAEVAQSSVAVRNGCCALQTEAGTLAERSDLQATSLEHGATALAEMTRAVRQTATAAEGARIAAGRAKADTLRSAKIIKSANDTMRAIEDFTRRIGMISGTINEISGQTNLLAFNASVEAARERTSSSGFGVIAVEIRALANRALDSAAEINAIVGDSDTLIRKGMVLVDDVSGALDLIGNQVAELDNQSGRIASAAGEQAAGLASINDTIGDVGALARENRGMADRAQVATSDLADQGLRLFNLVGRFQLVSRPAETI